MTSLKTEYLPEQTLSYLEHKRTLNTYIESYHQLKNQLYKTPDGKTLSQILKLMSTLDHYMEILAALQTTCEQPLISKYMLEVAKIWLLLGNIRMTMFDLKVSILLQMGDESYPPTFDTLQEFLLHCMDAVVFYRGQAYYLNQENRSFVLLEIPQEKQNEFFSLRMRCQDEPYMGLISFDELKPLVNNPDTPIGPESSPSKIAIIKDIVPHLTKITFKDDLFFQQQFYYAQKAAKKQLEHTKNDECNIDFATIKTNFIDKCTDYTLIVDSRYLDFKKLINMKNALKDHPQQIKLYKDRFIEQYDKVVSLFKRTKPGPKQKITYIKTNYFAHYVELNAHPSLQNKKNTIDLSLKIMETWFAKPGNDKNHALAKNNYDFIQTYINVLINLRNRYLNTAEFLCEDMQEIKDDISYCISYSKVSRKVSEVLITEIMLLMRWWDILKNYQDIKYKNSVYDELLKYKSLIMQYDACYQLINKHMQVSPQKNELYLQKLNQFLSDFSKIQKPDNEKQAQTIDPSLFEEKASKPTKKTRPQKQVCQPKTSTPSVTEKSPRPKKIQEQKTEKDDLDVLIEQGQTYISQTRYHDARPHVQRAYTLSLYRKDIKRQLSALDCICSIEGHALEEHLKSIEKSAQYNNYQTQKILEEGIKNLENQLPELKKLHDKYHEVALSLSKSLSMNEREGISYNREHYWNILLNIDNRITALIEREAQLQQHYTKKSEITNSNIKNDEVKQLQNKIEKQIDDMATEEQPITITRLDTSKKLTFKMQLPDHALELFQCLDKFQGEHYLIGSLPIQLIQQHFNLPCLSPHDADFISTCSDRKSLICAGFIENTFMRTLYTLYRKEQLSIDLTSLKEEDDWLMKSLLAKDFRITALCIDKKGNVIDPTGEGINDLKAKRLTMIGDPVERIKQDPVLLIRTIKYMIFGFKPDQKLLNALQTWKPDPETDFSKLYAASRKHLKTAERDAIIQLMKQYGLLQKIFKLNDETLLLSTLGIDIKPINPNQFFSTPPTVNNSSVQVADFKIRQT